MKKFFRLILLLMTKINPRSPTILNPGFVLYPIFKITYGFPNLFYKIKDYRTKKLKKNKLIITENTDYFKYFWEIFDEYMKSPKKEKEITRKGYISRMSFFNYSNQSEMRELTESEIKNIITFFEPWINIVKEYFKSPVSILNIRSWRDHEGAKLNKHIDGLPYGTIKIMLYRGENSMEKGTFYVHLNKNNKIPIIGNNTVFIFDQNHLFHQVAPLKKGTRDCIELLLIADRRERIVSAGNVAEYPANPFKDWTLKAENIEQLNRWFYIGV